MGSPSGAFSISPFVQKEDVNNRIALRIYYKIADCFLRQADECREEKNIILLFIMLMKFSSLMSETIPCHRDYLVSLKSERLSFEKKLLNALTELETLKPTVQSLIEEQNRKHLIEEQNRKHMKKEAKSDQVQYPSNLDLTAVDEMPTPAEMPRFLPVPRHCFLGPTTGLRQWQPPSTDSGVQYPSNLDLTLVDEMPTPAEMPRFLPVPRHCFLGPTTGLHGQWQPPSTDSGVQYRSNLDLTAVDEMPTPAEMPRFLPVPRHCFLGPTTGLRGQWQPPSTDSGVQYPSTEMPTRAEMPSLSQPAEDGVMAVKDSGDSESKRSSLESVLSLNDGIWSLPDADTSAYKAYQRRKRQPQVSSLWIGDY